MVENTLLGAYFFLGENAICQGWFFLFNVFALISSFKFYHLCDFRGRLPSSQSEGYIAPG